MTKWATSSYPFKINDVQLKRNFIKAQKVKGGGGRKKKNKSKVTFLPEYSMFFFQDMI